MRKIYVYLVSVILAIAGSSYLVVPTQIAAISTDNIDVSTINIIRSGGGLYLGIVFLILFFLRKKYIDECILIIAIIMIGLIFGRVMSIFIDGMPNIKILVSLVIEAIICFIGFIIYRSTRKTLHS